MTSWPNVITHNYICLFEPNLSFSIKGLRRTIYAKLKQATGMKLLVEVHMVVVWHTFSKWRETTIACISYYMCLNVINKESEWLIPTSSLCEILRTYYNYNSSLLYSLYFWPCFEYYPISRKTDNSLPNMFIWIWVWFWIITLLDFWNW